MKNEIIRKEAYLASRGISVLHPKDSARKAIEKVALDTKSKVIEEASRVFEEICLRCIKDGILTQSDISEFKRRLE